MAVKLKSLGDFTAQQPLIRGAVVDMVLGEPPLRNSSIELWRRGEDGALLSPYPSAERPLPVRLLPRGRFVIAGDPQTAFVTPVIDEVLRLTLRVVTAGYQPQQIDLDLDLTALEPSTEARTIAPAEYVSSGGVVQQVTLLKAPVWEDTIVIVPLRRHLAGRVVDESQPETAIAGATVSIINPMFPETAASDADGYFRINDLPLAKKIVLRASKAGFHPLVGEMLLDYRVPINTFAFALAPIAP